MSSLNSPDVARLLKNLSSIAKELDDTIEGTLSNSTLKQREKCDSSLKSIVDILQNIRKQIDPSKHEEIAINMGKPHALARFFAFSFVERPLSSFNENLETRFFGSGVYAIYYSGNNIPVYSPIANTETPIYVGKAIPANNHAETAFDQGTALFERLRFHKKSIGLGRLEPGEFKFRHAIIQSGMEGAVEDFMIRLFRPIWNKISPGFGKHGDSAKTRANKRSLWDTMHPGRPWAQETLEDQAPKETIIDKITEHFANHPPLTDKAALYQQLAL